MYQYADHEYFIPCRSGRSKTDHGGSQSSGTKRLQWNSAFADPGRDGSEKAAGALNWAVAEMMKRYQLFAQQNVRDLKGYNEKIAQMTEEGAPKNCRRL